PPLNRSIEAMNGVVRMVRILLILLSLALIGCSASTPTTAPPPQVAPDPPQPTLTRYQYTRILMGTPCTITLYANSEPEAASACTQAFQYIASIDDMLSDYRENSEAMRVFRGAPGEWHPVSPDLAAILAGCQTMHEKTD